MISIFELKSLILKMCKAHLEQRDSICQTRPPPRPTKTIVPATAPQRGNDASKRVYDFQYPRAKRPPRSTNTNVPATAPKLDNRAFKSDYNSLQMSTANNRGLRRWNNGFRRAGKPPCSGLSSFVAPNRFCEHYRAPPFNTRCRKQKRTSSSKSD